MLQQVPHKLFRQNTRIQINPQGTFFQYWIKLKHIKTPVYPPERELIQFCSFFSQSAFLTVRFVWGVLMFCIFVFTPADSNVMLLSDIVEVLVFRLEMAHYFFLIFIYLFMILISIILNIM